VHQAVAEVVQVQAFAGDVGAHQHAQRVIQAAEALDQGLLLGVGHAAVQHLQLLGLELQVGGEALPQPVQRFDALGEDDETVVGVVLAQPKLVERSSSSNFW
jgi:hypothetical protein